MVLKSKQQKSLAATGGFLDITAKFGKKKRIVEIRENGKSFDTVFLDSIAKIGGLHTTIFGILAILKDKLTRSETIGIMTQRLFLIKKKAEHNPDQLNRQSTIDSDFKKHKALLDQIEKGKLSDKDTQKLITEVLTERQPLLDFLSERTKPWQILKNIFKPLFTCCLKKGDAVLLDKKREKQAVRKFAQACDIVRILQSVDSSKLLSDLMLTN